MKYKRIVIKIGTSLITQDNGNLNNNFISELAKICKKLNSSGHEIVIISSGAIGAGIKLINTSRTQTLDKNQTSIKQVLASLGQPYLMKNYQEIFLKSDIQTSQILLTRKEISDDKSTYLNIKNAIEKIIELKIIPIINENDVVSTEEVEGNKFGDNDTLSAYVSNLIDANLLIILSSLDGVFTADPNLDPKNAKLIQEFKDLSFDEISTFGGPSADSSGTGGMSAKLKAIEIATKSGTDVVVTNGNKLNNITKIIKNEKIGTYFPAKSKILERKKRWLLNNMSRTKSITIDDGAKNAILNQNTSLLPAGIINVSGRFKSGEVICVLDKQKEIVASGITSYSYEEINKIKGEQSSEILSILGYVHTEEVIHKNNMVKI